MKKNLEVTTEELKELRKSLNSYTNKWSGILAEKIVNVGKKKKDKNLISITPAKIYNIIYGSVKDNYWRSVVLKYGTQLSKRFERSMIAIRKEIKK